MAETWKETELMRHSWYDHLETLLVGLPGPYWVVWIFVSLLVFGLPLIIISQLAKLPISKIDPLIFLSIAQGTYFAVLIRYLDKHALSSFDELRPVLQLSADEIKIARSKLLYLPAWPTFALSLVTLALIVLQIILLGWPYSLESSDSTLLVFSSIIYSFVWIMNSMILFHLFQRARFMEKLLTDRSDLSLFQQGGIHSYSLQGTRFTMLFMLMPLLWIFLDPGPGSLIIVIVFGMIAFSSFVYPILGVHRVLEGQKQDLLAALSTKVEKEISRISAGNEVSGQFSTNLDELEKAYSAISRYSTWPWSPGTFRQLIAAITLPLVVWLLQYFLGRLISVP